ncbi:Imm40 family immunity protein [Enterococcus gilvus]|uniref:Imm40 family immunity protein n=1 Tax=Enterococcus gilvus TaxID=160453 RepID=UPI0028D8B830|nr:Imm40 family immunity protein [Enterococcus gilvus]
MNHSLELWQNILPTELINHAYDLENYLGLFELAWSKEDLMIILQILEKKRYLLLGGDVYKFVGNTIESTYDSWYFEGKDSFESVDTAQKYISNYLNRNNDGKYLFSLIINND